MPMKQMAVGSHRSSELGLVVIHKNPGMPPGEIRRSSGLVLEVIRRIPGQVLNFHNLGVIQMRGQQPVL